MRRGADRSARRRQRAAHGHPQFAMQALAAPHRHCPRQGERAWRRRTARPRTARVGGAAAGGCDRALAGAAGRAGFRRACRRGAGRPRHDRGRQRRGRGARDCGRAARGDGRAGQNRRAGDARSRARAPRAGGARALECGGRRFRRRCACRHAGRRVRAAGRGGGAGRAGAGDAARAAQASAVHGLDARAVATLERAILRGPRPKPRQRGAGTCAATLPRRAWKIAAQGAVRAASFRSACRRSDGFRARCGCRSRRQAQGGARAAGNLAAGPAAVPRHRRAASHGRWSRSAASPRNWPKAFDEIVEAGSAAVEPADYAELFHTAIADQQCGGRKRTCACASTARSKRGCNRSIAWCSAAWSRASGRRRRASTPGSAGRCATSSASICRSGASASRRTISPRRSARREVILTRAGQARRRADGGVAICAAARRGRGRGALAGRARARRTLSRACAHARPPVKVKSVAAARAEAAARGAADAAERHRDRALAARSLHDLRQASSAACAARCDRHAAGRGRSRHRHPRAIGEFTTTFAEQLPDDPVGELIALGERHFAAARRLSGGARVLVAALSAHRAMVRGLRDRAARQALAVRRGNSRQHRDSVRRSRSSRCACAPTASSG